LFFTGGYMSRDRDFNTEDALDSLDLKTLRKVCVVEIETDGTVKEVEVSVEKLSGELDAVALAYDHTEDILPYLVDVNYLGLITNVPDSYYYEENTFLRS